MRNWMLLVNICCKQKSCAVKGWIICPPIATRLNYYYYCSLSLSKGEIVTTTRQTTRSRSNSQMPQGFPSAREKYKWIYGFWWGSWKPTKHKWWTPNLTQFSQYLRQQLEHTQIYSIWFAFFRYAKKKLFSVIFVHGSFVRHAMGLSFTFHFMSSPSPVGRRAHKFLGQTEFNGTTQKTATTIHKKNENENTAKHSEWK